MTNKDRTADQPGLLDLSGNSSSDQIQEYYDGWADDYDQDLASWNYDAPAIAAGLLKRHVQPDAAILDVGCGTGLSGLALQSAGFVNLAGVDISEKSLEAARQTGVYGRLDQVDLHDLPLSQTTASFGGLQCVGVLSYVPDTEAILREFCRLVSPDGVIVFSQRQDLFIEREYEAVLHNLADDGACTSLTVSDPKPYLPGNDEFGEDVLVIYVALQVSS